MLKAEFRVKKVYFSPEIDIDDYSSETKTKTADVPR